MYNIKVQNYVFMYSISIYSSLMDKKITDYYYFIEYITQIHYNITLSSMDLPQMILLETGVPVRWLASKSG